MKSMWPPLAAIFFMTCFYRARGGPWPPRPPPLDPLLIIASGKRYSFHFRMNENIKEPNTGNSLFHNEIRENLKITG